jgi:hypothetical protein
MAREAGLVYLSNGLWWMDAGEAGYELKTFEALVRADERDRAMRENAYVQAEREACAKLCDKGVDTEHPTVKGHIMKDFGRSSLLAKAIRARGNT